MNIWEGDALLDMGTRFISYHKSGKHSISHLMLMLYYYRVVFWFIASFYFFIHIKNEDMLKLRRTSLIPN